MGRLPRLYVKCGLKECISHNIASVDCVVLEKNIEIWLKKGETLPEFIGKNANFLRREVYDRFHEYVDRTTSKMRTDAILVLPDGRTRIYLREGDELIILPVEGFSKTLIADVGNRVRKGDAFAAVTTRSGNIHYLSPPKNGVVIFIDEISNRPHYLYYLLPEDV